MFQLKNNKKTGAEVFTAAMNDIMFFLMLFFIITSTLLNPHIIKVNLPGAKSTQTVQKKEVSLSIDKDLKYFVNNKQVPFSNLQATLANEIKDDKDASVILRCDSTITIQKLVNVLEIGNNLNVKMTLATKKKK